MLYPTAAAWVYQYSQAGIIQTLGKQVKVVDPSAKDQIQAAREYNKAIRSGARLAPNTNVPLSDVHDTESALGLWQYDDILNISKTGMMGRIVIPKAEVDLPIFHGTTESSLLRGAGHLQGTSLPVGGIDTRTVITAHRGLADATMFTYLDRLETGDLFTLNIFDEILTYRVIETKVVAPEDSESVQAVRGRDLATLVTCTPLGINSHRILVTGERIIPTPASEEKLATEKSRLPHFPWFAVGYVILFLACLGLIIHSGIQIYRMRHAHRNPEQNSETTANSYTPKHLANPTD